MTIETTFGEARANYFVIREGGKAPSYKHDSRIGAEREAARLAKKTPGGVFHIAKIKKTIKNTDDPLAAHDAEGQPATFDQRQLARTMSDGDQVQVVGTHYAHPNKAGVIRDVFIPDAPNENPAIWVDLFGEITPVRFSPSSLTVTKARPKTEAPEPKEDISIDDLRPRSETPFLDMVMSVVRAAAAASKAREDAEPTEVNETDYPGLGLKPGEECVLLMRTHEGIRGKFVRKDPDDRRLVWVHVNGTPEPWKVNASRVYSLTDKRIHVINV